MTDIEGFLTIYGHSDNLLNDNYIFLSDRFSEQVQTGLNLCRHSAQEHHIQRVGYAQHLDLKLAAFVFPCQMYFQPNSIECVL